MDTKITQIKPDQTRSNLKLISTTEGVRISQACDRCRIKKIKCDGTRPCKNCSKSNFECKTSDQLSRRAFPRGYTENLERRLAELEAENRDLKLKRDQQDLNSTIIKLEPPLSEYHPHTFVENDRILFKQTLPLPLIPLWNTDSHHTTQFNGIQINNPIDQIFNIDNNGLIIGNDNINFESQLNQLLLSLGFPFLRISNSHNFISNSDNEFEGDLRAKNGNQTSRTQRWDLSLTYNPTMRELESPSSMCSSVDDELPTDVYDFFIKLINNFRMVFHSRTDMDEAMLQFFLNHNTLIPILDYSQFMTMYESLHTLYPFMFTYHDATMNGFNLSNNKNYNIVNGHLMTVIQIYAISLIVDPSLCLNLLLNHPSPKYSTANYKKEDHQRPSSIISSVFDFLPYLNVFDVSIDKLKTYQLFLYYSLITNNKRKSLVLSSLVNAFIGVLGINLNCKNLFFNDLPLPIAEKRNRVTCFWVFKVLLKIFNLKFGFKPSLNTTVINPITIDRYWQLTPEKLARLLHDDDDEHTICDELFKTLLKPSVEFLNLMNIIIPSSFSPQYYQYLKQGKKKQDIHRDHFRTAKHLDWILNEDDGDGNDGNLNYNFHQFLTIDKNLCAWRDSLRVKSLHFRPLTRKLGLKLLNDRSSSNLYHDLRGDSRAHISEEALADYFSSGIPNAETATHLIRVQLNFHYILIRSTNYLNFIVDKELNFAYYVEISSISREVLRYFCLIFGHLRYSQEVSEPVEDPGLLPEDFLIRSLGFDVDEDGNVINDFSVKRRKRDHLSRKSRLARREVKIIPKSPFNAMLNGLGMTVINLKKTILLQMVYLHICQLKHQKRGEFEGMQKIHKVLMPSIDLFKVVFVNFRPNMHQTRQDQLYDEMINNTLRPQTQPPTGDDGLTTIDLHTDWDDPTLDEDLKYLRIIKGIGEFSEQHLHVLPT